MGGKSAKAPDYRGAAEESAAASKDVTEYQTHANRGNTYTPWGSSEWSSESVLDPVSGKMMPKWTNTIGLSEGQQGALDDQQAIQSGRSEIAKGMLGNANQEMSTPQDFWNTLPDVAQTPNVPDYYGQGLPSMGEFPDPNAQAGESFDFQGGYSGLGGYGQTPQAGTDTGIPQRGDAPDQNQYQSEQIQRGLDFSGAGDVNAGGGYNPDFAQTQYDRQMSLAEPQMQKAQTQLDVSLRNQGLRPGTEAYDNAMGDLQDQQGEERSRMQQDSMRLGAQEQQNQFGREMQQRQQGVSEQGMMGNFANQAAQQALNQQLGLGGQQFSEQMQGGTYADQQRQQAMAEQNQFFGQGMQEQQARDAQRGQQFGELKDMQGMFGGQADARFNRELQAAQFANQQRQQLGNEQLAFGNQGFNQQMQQGAFQQQQRQNAIAEQMQREGWSLNKINAMLSGQQVGMPQFQNQPNTTAGASQGADYLGAANMQGQQQAANAGGMFGALGQIGGGVAAGYFSDERLKENIQKVKTVGGLDLVTWTWNGLLGLAGESIGFIAQEVQKVFPQHVYMTDSGYLGIDYGALEKELDNA